MSPARGAGKDGREVNLTPHRLSPRPGNKGDLPDEGLTTVIGFIGDADDADRARVYLNLGFDSYVEMAKSDVIRTAPVDSKDENSPTIVWLSNKAQVSVVSVGRMGGDADLVTGSIRSRYGGRGGGRGRGPAAADPVSEIICSVFCKQPPVRTDDPFACHPYSNDCTGDIFCPPAESIYRCLPGL
jgi:hypothetical protein